MLGTSPVPSVRFATPVPGVRPGSPASTVHSQVVAAAEVCSIADLGPEVVSRPLLHLKLTDMLESGWTMERRQPCGFDVENKKLFVDSTDIQASLEQLALAAGEPSPLPQPFKTFAATEEKAKWLRDIGKAVEGDAAAVDAALYEAAAEIVAKGQRLGPSLRHADAGLYLHEHDGQYDALIVRRAPNGDISHVDLPTPLEDALDLPACTYQLLESGKVLLNSVGKNEFDAEAGLLHLDPYTKATFEAAKAAVDRTSGNTKPDFTAEDFHAKVQDEGTEKTMHVMTKHPDTVLLVQRPENEMTQASLGRKEVEMEVIVLKRLARMDYPVPVVERVVQVRNHDGEMRWGYVEAYFKDAINSKAGKNHYMNQRTIDVAQRIKAKLKEDDLHVSDLQFLICPDGDLVLIDPKGFGKGALQANVAALDALIGQAQEQVNERGD